MKMGGSTWNTPLPSQCCQTRKAFTTFRQGGPCLIGADWDKSTLLKTMRRYEGTLERTGPQASAMKHGLALTDNHGVLFIETLPS